MIKRIVGMLALALATLPLAAAPSHADCTCRYDGKDYEQGEMVCQRGPQGVRLARCGMMQNNSFWQYLDAPCPQAGMTPMPARTPTGGFSPAPPRA